jgi:homogentisate 1,2-dioxygenase
VPLLFNPTSSSRRCTRRGRPVYFANGDGDDLYFVAGGRRRLRTPLGDVTFAARDYVFVPKGLLHRFVPDDGPQAGCRSSAGGFGLPAQWRNAVGQLRMDAPFGHRDFRRPVFAGRATKGCASWW